MTAAETSSFACMNPRTPEPPQRSGWIWPGLKCMKRICSNRQNSRWFRISRWLSSPHISYKEARMKIFRNRTVVGVLCILLALLICFGVTPLFSRSASEKVPSCESFVDSHNSLLLPHALRRGRAVKPFVRMVWCLPMTVAMCDAPISGILKACCVCCARCRLHPFGLCRPASSCPLSLPCLM